MRQLLLLRLDTEVDLEASGTYSTEIIRDDAVSVILGHNSSKPLFLYLPFQVGTLPQQTVHHFSPENNC